MTATMIGLLATLLGMLVTLGTMIWKMSATLTRSEERLLSLERRMGEQVEDLKEEVGELRDIRNQVLGIPLIKQRVDQHDSVIGVLTGDVSSLKMFRAQHDARRSDGDIR